MENPNLGQLDSKFTPLRQENKVITFKRISFPFAELKLHMPLPLVWKFLFMIYMVRLNF